MQRAFHFASWKPLAGNALQEWRAEVLPMFFSVVECEMDGEVVGTRRVVAAPTTSREAAEALLVRLAQGHMESGFNGQGHYWWARDPLGRELRFLIEHSAAPRPIAGPA